jgi:RHS repeat-associated protein
LNRYYVNDNGDMRAYAAADTNQYTGVWGSAAPSYDGNFNLTAYNGFQGVYDAENHLVGGSMQATYDGLGRCVRRTTPSGTLVFTYDGWKPILEWDGAGNWSATNVYGAGADEILARQDSAGHILIYKQDQHGNVAAVLTDNGDVTEKYTYDAFGKPSIFDKWGNGRAATAIGNRFLFQGREWISELGIYDYRHRMYQPELGRFLQTDPMGLQTEGEKLSAGQKALFSPGGVAPEAFGSSEMNLFRYCGDDPIDGSDPLGLLRYRFSEDYPDKGPGGREVVKRTIEKELRNNKKGRELLNADGVVTIHPVSAGHPQTSTTFIRDPKIKEFDTYLDPTNSRFQDANTFRALSKHPGELPPDSDRGRAAIIGHEFTHGVLKIKDEIETIRRGENPIRAQFDPQLPPRRSAGGDQFIP